MAIPMIMARMGIHMTIKQNFVLPFNVCFLREYNFFELNFIYLFLIKLRARLMIVDYIFDSFKSKE